MGHLLSSTNCLRDLSERHPVVPQVSLSRSAPQLPEEGQLRRRRDPLRHHGHTCGMPQRDDRGRNGEVVFAFMQTRHEGAVKLEDARRQSLEVGE